MNIGLLGAFVGGLLTLLSPCSVMLLPAFFSYAFSKPSALLARTGVFYLGLITTLVPLGVLAGTLGAFVNQNRQTFVQVASVVVIVLGLLLLLNIPIPMVNSDRSAAGASTASVYALGTIYGLAGVCAGPLLGAVLTFAAVAGNALYGGIILLVFAAGMAVPLLLLSLVWQKLPFVQKLVKPREVHIGAWSNTWTGIIGGILTVAVGVLMLATSGTTSLGGILGASQQASIEGWVLTSTGSVPDLVVLVVVLALAGVVWLVGTGGRRRRKSETPTLHVGLVEQIDFGNSTSPTSQPGTPQGDQKP